MAAAQHLQRCAHSVHRALPLVMLCAPAPARPPAPPPLTRTMGGGSPAAASSSMLSMAAPSRVAASARSTGAARSSFPLLFMPAAARGRWAAARGGVASTGSSSSPSDAPLPMCRPSSAPAALARAWRAAVESRSCCEAERKRLRTAHHHMIIIMIIGPIFPPKPSMTAMTALAARTYRRNPASSMTALAIRT